MSDEKSDVKNGVKDTARTSVPKAVAFGKDLVALLRDLALFVLALLLLFFPTTFNSLLSEAGFEEGSFVGFKWKPKLLDYDAKLKEAQAIITDLREQNDKMSKALGEVGANLSDPALKQELAKLEEGNKQLTIASAKVEDSVASTIAANAQFVERVDTTADSNTKWGIVFGGDATADAARHEVDIAVRKLGIPNASIYLRRGSYRSVSVVESRKQAQQILPRLKQQSPDAYIVDMSSWCPNSNEKTGYRECVSP